MMIPSKVKYRKVQRGKNYGKAKGAYTVHFGDYAISALERGMVTAKQLEAARIAISRFIKKEGKIYFRVFPDHPFSKKPQESRMGKGKGAPEIWVAKVKPGRIILEVSGIPEHLAHKALWNASQKLPIKTKIISRKDTSFV